MKRKSNGVGVLEEGEEGVEEVEEKRIRLEENGGNKVVKAATKCPICLWPAGAPECYHTASNSPQTEL